MQCVVVCGRCQDDVGEPERIGHHIGGVGACDVVHVDLGDTLLLQEHGEPVGDRGGVPVHRCVCDDDSLVFGLVPAPEVVLSEDVAEVLPPDGSVQGTDHLDRHTLQLLEHGLDLASVLSDDVGVVPPGLLEVLGVEVGLIRIQGTGQGLEGTEGIRGKQGLGCGVVGEHDLGPVDHHCEHELQVVLSEGELVALLDLQLVLGDETIEVVQHVECLRVTDDGDLGVHLENLSDSRSVVGLHVVDHEVVQGPAGEGAAQFLPEHRGDGEVAGVQKGGLLVHDDVRVV